MESTPVFGRCQILGASPGQVVFLGFSRMSLAKCGPGRFNLHDFFMFHSSIIRPFGQSRANLMDAWLQLKLLIRSYN